MIEVQARVAGEVLRLHAEHPAEEIALVSHGDPLRALICHFVGMPLDFSHRIEISIGSVSVLRLGEDGARLASMNVVPVLHER